MPKLFGTEVDIKAIDILNEKEYYGEESKEIECVKAWEDHAGNFFPIYSVVSSLEPGFYTANMNMSGPYVSQKEFIVDDIVKLPDAKSEKIIAEADKFWELKETFVEMGFIHKRGILLYGDPGSGKSQCVYEVGMNIISKKGLVLYISNPYAGLACLNVIRARHPEMKVLVVIEDIDDIVNIYGDKLLTSILDGENRFSHVLFLATTNYPERLPVRLVNRPSRFDVVEEMDFPSYEARKVFLAAKAPSLTEEQLETWGNKTEGFSIPMLKELLISVLGYMRPLDASIERINKLMKSFSGSLF